MARASRLVTLLALATGCEAVTDFSLTPVAESNDELCSDGRDNNFDGLTDCQDWGCLDRPPCCDIPEVVLDDDFEDGPASCDDASCTNVTCSQLECGPRSDTWYTWPCPFAKTCAGALRFDKAQCYEQGLLSKTSFALVSGLVVDAELVGVPERLGHIEITLTLQGEADLPGSLDPCGTDQQLAGFVALRQTWAAGGFLLDAEFQGQSIGSSPIVTSLALPHHAAISIDADQHVVYALDGVTFATSATPIPPSSEQARLGLSGLTQTAAFGSVKVIAGIRCHDPSSWALHGGSLASAEVLAGTGTGTAFDSDEVFNPSVHTVGPASELYYTGCHLSPDTHECDRLLMGIGRATQPRPGQPFVRDAGNPRISVDDLGGGALRFDADDFSVDVSPEGPLRGYVTVGTEQGAFRLDDTGRPSEDVLLGIAGRWDGFVCCTSAVDSPAGTRIYYGGRPGLAQNTWRIGLALDRGQGEAVRSSPDPVVSVGATDTFDSDTVSNPAVVFDATRGYYRMWFEARDFFGKSSIGYAVSADGTHWSAAPGNPVVTPKLLGLSSVGGPAVLLAPDGRLRMFIHGTTANERRRRIFELDNDGSLGPRR